MYKLTVTIKIVVFQLLILSAFQVFSQSMFEFKKGEMYAGIRDTRTLPINAMYFDGKYYYFIKSDKVDGHNNGKFVVQKLDKDMNLSTSQEIIMYDKSMGSEKENRFEFYCLDSSYLIVHIKYKKARLGLYDESLTFYSYSFNGKLLSKKFFGDNSWESGDWFFKITDDKKKVMCYKKNSVNNSNRKETMKLSFNLQFFDQKLNKLWEKEVMQDITPFKNEDYITINYTEFYQVEVSNEGDFYLVFYPAFPDPLFQKKYYPNSADFFLFSVPSNSENAKYMPLFIEDKKVQSVRIKSGENHSFYMTAYAKGQNVNYYMSIDGNTLKNNFVKKEPFNSRFVEFLAYDRAIQRAKDDTFKFEIPFFHNIVRNKDRSFTVFRLAKKCIIVTKLNENFEEMWNAYIAKGSYEVHSYTIYPTDYGYFEKDSDLVVVYNDLPENTLAKRVQDTKDFNFDEASNVFAIVSPGGLTEKGVFFTPTDRRTQSIYFQPKLTLPMVNQEGLILRYAGDFLQYGLLKMKY